MDFMDWLSGEIEKSGLSYSEIGRRGKFSHARISQVMSGEPPGPVFCINVARGLGISAETVLRRAGHLPPRPEMVEDEEQAINLYRRLDARLRESVVATMRHLLGIETVQERPSAADRLQYEIRQELQALPLREQEEVAEYIRSLSERERGGSGALNGRPVDAGA